MSNKDLVATFHEEKSLDDLKLGDCMDWMESSDRIHQVMYEGEINGRMAFMRRIPVGNLNYIGSYRVTRQAIKIEDGKLILDNKEIRWQIYRKWASPEFEEKDKMLRNRGL